MKKYVHIWGVSITSVIMAFFQMLVYPYLYKFGMSNIMYYMLFSIVFIGVYLISYYLLRNQSFIDFDNTKILYGILGISFVGWFATMYFQEPGLEFFLLANMLRHRVPWWLYFGGIIVTTLVISFLISKNSKNNHKFRFGIAVVIAIFQSACLWAPNIISDMGGSLFHIHAYFNPIYNAVNFVPITEYTGSIYGHYYLFYMIPVKLLALMGVPEVYGVIAFTMLTCFVAFIAFYLFLHFIIDNDFLYLFSVLAITYLSFSTYQLGQYYQLLPHRIIFVSLTLLFIELRKKKRVPGFLIWIIVGLAVLWNFESGIVCFIVAACENIIKLYENDNFSMKSFSLSIFKLIGKMFLVLAIDLVFLNLVNLLMGGSLLGISELIYPVANSDFIVGELQLKLPDVTAFYFLEIIIFLGGLIHGVLKVFKTQNDDNNYYCILLCLMGLGLLPYYLNRAAVANISISHLCFVGVISIKIQMILDSGWTLKSFLKSSLERIELSIYIIILSFFVLGSICNIKFTFDNRIQTVWDTKSLNMLCDVIEDNIPKDTVAVGVGLPDIYSILDWNPGIRIMDYSDLETSPLMSDYVRAKVRNEKKVLFYQDTYDALYNKYDWIVLSNIADKYFYCAQYENEKMDIAQGICWYSNANNLSDLEFIDLISLNFLGGYFEDDTRIALANSLSNDEEKRIQIAYYFWENN